MPFFREQLRPAVPLTWRRLESGFANSTADVVERQKAELGLEQLSDQVEDELRLALKSTQLLNVEASLRRLLHRLNAPTVEMLRGFRCVEILEYAGTPAARPAESIAAGAPGAHLTEAAAAALKRLAK